MPRCPRVRCPVRPKPHETQRLDLMLGSSAAPNQNQSARTQPKRPNSATENCRIPGPKMSANSGRENAALAVLPQGLDLSW
jgi:hypothetical protein